MFLTPMAIYDYIVTFKMQYAQKGQIWAPI